MSKPNQSASDGDSSATNSNGPAGVMSVAQRLRLTSLCKHYTSYYDIPADKREQLKKYWNQRYNLWSCYDDDIYMTDDAWFGVTPEPVALEIAQELDRKHHERSHFPSVIIDIFAGAGGNTIQFARSGYWDKVIGIELDEHTLACAQHNAEVYDVSDYITWVRGDCFDFLAKLRERPWELDEGTLRLFQEQRDSLGGNGTSLVPLAQNVEIFASPPWGGVGYEKLEVFDLEDMDPYGISEMKEACKTMACTLFLPRNGDLRQLANLVPDNSTEKLDCVQYCSNGTSKGLVAYFPADPATLNS